MDDNVSERAGISPRPICFLYPAVMNVEWQDLVHLYKIKQLPEAREVDGRHLMRYHVQASNHAALIVLCCSAARNGAMRCFLFCTNCISAHA
jgi:hypothetical protein